MAAPGRTNTLVSSIKDAEGMTSYFGYLLVGTNAVLSSMVTPYGSTIFEHWEATNVSFVPLPSYYWMSNGVSYVTNNGHIQVNVGSLGVPDTFNRAVIVTHPDTTKEIFAYRYTSDNLVPAAFATAPYDVLPTADDGVPPPGQTSLPIHGRLTSRNSFHWDRQHTPLVTHSDLASLTNMTAQEVSICAWSHWLADNDFSVSDQISSFRAASADGLVEGPTRWFDYFLKGSRWNAPVGADPTWSVSAVILPDGTTNYARTHTDYGLTTQIDESYTRENGKVDERSYYWAYKRFPFRQVWSDGASIPWSGSFLSSVTTPAGGNIVFEDPVNDATVTNNAALWITNIFPRRLHVEIRDSENNHTTLFYNSRQQLTGVVPDGGPVITNLYNPVDGFLQTSKNVDSGGVTTFDFATNGMPRSIITPSGLQMLYSWDKLDRLTNVSFPDFTSIQNTYDRLDVVARKDRLNHWTYAGFNSMDQLQWLTDANGKTTHFGWCSCGALGSITDPLGKTTTFARDRNGNILETLSDSNKVTYIPNLFGQVTQVYLTNGFSLTYLYNNQGRVTNVSGPSGRIFAAVYDEGDRPIRVTDASGITISNVFDSIGRLHSRTDPLNNTETFIYSQGHLSEYHDPLYRVTYYGYTAGLLSAVTNANFEVTQFGYNPSGNLTSLTDGRTHTKHWTWDQYGRQIAEINANSATVRTNAYDPNGRVTNSWSAAKGTVTYAYDNVGNLLAVHAPHSTLNFTYDDVNRLLTFGNELGTGTRTHANFGAFDGALASEALGGVTVGYGFSDAKLSSISIGSWSNTISCDGALRPHTFTSPAGSFTYGYNGAGGQIASLAMPGSVTSSRSYDAAGRLTNITSSIDSFGYAYNPASFVTNLTRAGGISVGYGYDNIGQLLSAVGHDPGNILRKNENLQYGYDASGNLAWRTNNTLIQSFVADSPNQLTNILRSGTLTVSGNVTGSVASVGVNGLPAELYSDGTFASGSGFGLTNAYNWFLMAVTNTSGQLVISRLTNVFLPSSISLRYDLNGNLLSDGQRYFEYDDFNQLTAVTISNVSRSEFVYDALGRRAITREYNWRGDGQLNVWRPIGETHYVYDGMAVLQERDTNNTVLATYTRGLDLSGSMQGAGGIGGLLARSQPTGTNSQHLYYSSDHAGNITAMFNSSGTVLARYLYDPYGNLLGKWGTMADSNRYRFSSKELHPNSGLLYYGFRFYDLNLQRWVNEDPIGEAGGINMHRFAANAGPSTVDPAGDRPVLIADPASGFFGAVDSYDLHYLGFDAVVQGRSIPRAADGSVPDTPLQDQPLAALGGESLSMQFGPDLAAAMVGIAMLDINSVLGPLSIPHEISEAWSDAGTASVNGSAGCKAACYGRALAAMLQPLLFAYPAARPAQVEQYALRAADSGFYPVMVRGFDNPQFITYLEKGDVWKFGTTVSRASRYSQPELRAIGEHGVNYSVEFSGTEAQAIRLQNMKIMNYRLQSGRLPPGNKVVN